MFPYSRGKIARFGEVEKFASGGGGSRSGTTRPRTCDYATNALANIGDGRSRSDYNSCGECRLREDLVQRRPRQPEFGRQPCGYFDPRNICQQASPNVAKLQAVVGEVAHTVDLFQYQTGDEIVVARAVHGPINRDLGIAMDMSIQLKARRGAICTLSLSFNNDGPIGTFFRYICDHGTYIARYDDLMNGRDERIDVSAVAISMNGIELQDRESVSAIREKREPNPSVQQVLSCYRVLHELQGSLA